MKKFSKANLKKTIVSISGMHCASCANTIEKALSKSKGVLKASVNFASEKAAIEFDSSKTDEGSLKGIIKKTGYKVIEEAEQGIKPSGDAAEARLKVIGMDNPHCIGTVGNAISTLKGIISKELYINQNAFIKYNPKLISITEIKKVIKQAGYEPIGQSALSVDTEKEARQKEIKKLKAEVITGFILSMPIFILSFPEWFRIILPYQNYILLVLTTPVQMILGRRFYIGAYIGLRNKTANMDTLIAVGTSAA